MVSLYVDGSKRLFSTDATTVGDVLKRSHVTLGQGDIVEPSISSKVPMGEFNVNVYRAQPVVVVDGTKKYYTKSAFQSPRLVAKSAGLKTYPEDTYATSVITNFVNDGSIGEQVTINRAKPLTILVDGSTRNIRTQAQTVGDALKGADISLGLSDTVSAPLTTPVVPGMTVTITRVTEAVVTLTATIPRPVHQIIDPNMLKGQTQVQNPGSDGQTTTTWKIHYTDGVETSRQALQVVSQTPAVPEVVIVGTKVLFAGSVEYWRPLVVQAAAQYGVDPNEMMKIMACESRGNATDVSAFVVNGQHPTGLFQYLLTTWESAGGTADNIFDGPTQIQLTARKIATSGTGAWACQ